MAVNEQEASSRLWLGKGLIKDLRTPKIPTQSSEIVFQEADQKNGSFPQNNVDRNFRPTEARTEPLCRSLTRRGGVHVGN